LKNEKLGEELAAPIAFSSIRNGRMEDENSKELTARIEAEEVEFWADNLGDLSSEFQDSFDAAST
jgi:hypothetical protein